jgi:RNA-binding protein
MSNIGDSMQIKKGADRRYLRGLANPLKPVVQIGSNGLNQSVSDAIDDALDAHELIKIKFLEFKDQKEFLCKQIEEINRCSCIGIIGHVAILYREHPDPEKRQIK